MINIIENRLRKLIVSNGEDININDINESTDLVRDFNYDSLNIIQLIVDIENMFSIEINDEDLLLERLSHYKNLLEILEIKLDKKYKKIYSTDKSI